MLLTQAAHRHQQPQTITWLTGEGRTQKVNTTCTQTAERQLQRTLVPWSTPTSEWKSNAPGSCDPSPQEQNVKPPENTRCSKETELRIRCLPTKKRKLWAKRLEKWKRVTDLKCSPQGENNSILTTLNYLSCMLIVNVHENKQTFTFSTSTYNKYIHLLFLMQLPRQLMLPRRQFCWKCINGERVQYLKILSTHFSIHHFITVNKKSEMIPTHSVWCSWYLYICKYSCILGM